MRALRCLLLGAALAVAAPAVVVTHAHADEKANADARARFREGLARAEKQDYEGARLAFVQAYAVIQAPDILFNLALAEEKSGRSVEAIRHFRDYVRDKHVKESDRDEGRKHIAALAKVTAHIEVTAPAGWNLFVDGAAWGMTPIFEPVDVAPGRHKVEVRTPEKRYELAIDTTIGEVAKASFVDMIMQGGGTPIPATSASGTGAAPAATTAPDAPATGAASGSVGPAPTAPAASADGGTTVAPETIWTPRNVTVIGLGVGAVAAVAVGVGFFMGASSQDDKVTQLKAANPNCAGSTSSGCADLATAADARASDRNVGTAFVIGGSALAVGAIAAFVFWPKADATKSSAVRIVPVAGPGSAGLRVVGHF